MPDTFPLAQELGKAVLLVSGLLVSCLVAGALFSVVMQWPGHWEAWKAKRNARRRIALERDYNGRAHAMKTWAPWIR